MKTGELQMRKKRVGGELTQRGVTGIGGERNGKERGETITNRRKKRDVSASELLTNRKIRRKVTAEDE